MTIVAAVFDHESCRGAIAADTGVDYGSHKGDGITKLVDKGDAIVGVAGSALWIRYVREFEEDLDLDEMPALEWAESLSDYLVDVASELGHRSQDHDGTSSSEFQFLVLTGEGIFAIDPTGCTLEIMEPFHAIGSGADVAIGSLFFSSRYGFDRGVATHEHVESAVESAIAHGRGCHGGILIRTIGDDVEEDGDDDGQLIELVANA